MIGMAMDVGPRGGIGHDPDTHRAGTDWDKDGSIGMGDGAMSMLVMDHVMHGEDADSAARQAVRETHRKGKAHPSVWDWMKHHYILVISVVTFAIVFSFLMVCR